MTTFQATINKEDLCFPTTRNGTADILYAASGFYRITLDDIRQFWASYRQIAFRYY